MIVSRRGCLQAVCNQCEFVGNEREQSAPLVCNESEQRNAMFASRGDDVCKLLHVGSRSKTSSGTSARSSAAISPKDFFLRGWTAVSPFGSDTCSERSCSWSSSRALAMAGSSIDTGCPVSRDSEASIPFCSGVSSNGVCSIMTPYQGNDWAARLSLPPQSLQPCRMGCPRYIDDLGNSGQLLPPKAWHAHGNAYFDVGHFYPNLAEVGMRGIFPHSTLHA